MDDVYLHYKAVIIFKIGIRMNILHSYDLTERLFGWIGHDFISWDNKIGNYSIPIRRISWSIMRHWAVGCWKNISIANVA